MLNAAELRQLPVDAVSRRSIADDVVRPAVIGAFVPHLEKALLPVVDDAAADDNQLPAVDLLWRLQFNNRITLVFRGLVENAKRIMHRLDDVVVDEELLPCSDRHDVAGAIAAEESASRLILVHNREAVHWLKPVIVGLVVPDAGRLHKRPARRSRIRALPPLSSLWCAYGRNRGMSGP